LKVKRQRAKDESESNTNRHRGRDKGGREQRQGVARCLEELQSAVEDADGIAHGFEGLDDEA
jgi:hypothetical protein